MAAREPVFNLPRSVVIAAAVIVGVQFLRDLLPDVEDARLLLTLAFIPARYSGEASELPGGYVTCVTSFFTYMIVHGGWVHVIVNVLWMVAFGSAVAKRIGDVRFLYFSTLCGVAGALTYLVFHLGGLAPMIGASAAISGQMAGALRFFFNMRWSGPGAAPPDLTQVPLASLGETFRDRRIVLFLVIWIVLNVVFGLIPQPLIGAGGGIAWEAHIGGFVCGLLSFGFFDRSSLETPQPFQAR